MRLAGPICAAAATALIVGATATSPPIYLDPDTIGKTPTTSWTTFNGDYSGQLYSTLTQIDPGNVNELALLWVHKITDVGAQRGAPVPMIKCTPLLVEGVLYFTIPDHVWALDAHSGKEMWHYDWVDHGGPLIWPRG